MNIYVGTKVGTHFVDSNDIVRYCIEACGATLLIIAI